MDIIVKPTEDGAAWTLTDLLGRSMGAIAVQTDGTFVIRPDGQALETLKGMTVKPYRSLDGALTAIETHSRGLCRRAPVSAVQTAPVGPAGPVSEDR